MLLKKGMKFENEIEKLKRKKLILTQKLNELEDSDEKLEIENEIRRIDRQIETLVKYFY